MGKGAKEFAGDDLHHVVSQCYSMNVFDNAFKDLEYTVWEIY
jgi:hypothetical protein